MSKSICLTQAQVAELTELKNNPKTPATVQKRAEAILLLEAGSQCKDIAKQIIARIGSVYDWVGAFQNFGIDGIKNTSGRKSESAVNNSVANVSGNVTLISDNVNVSGNATLSSDNANVSDCSQVVCEENKKNTRITVTIKIEDGNHTVEKTVVMDNVIPGIAEIDFENKTSFANSVGNIHSSIFGVVRDISNEVAENYCSFDPYLFGRDEKKYLCEFETVEGRINIWIPHSLRIQLATNERVWEPNFYEKFLNCVRSLTIRDATNIVNSFSNRNEETKINYRTSEYTVQKESEIIKHEINENRKKILKENGFDHDTGDIIDESKLDEDIVNPNIPQDDNMFEKNIEAIQDYNESQDKNKYKIDDKNMNNLMQIHPKDSVVISVDYNDCWKQKENRSIKNEDKKDLIEEDVKDSNDKIKNNIKYSTENNNNAKNKSKNKSKNKNKKERKKVREATVHVTTIEGTQGFVGATVTLALLNALAYLFLHGFLKNRELIFFTDGAKDINNVIKKIFGFRPYSIFLDWYHLIKKTYEFLSMALYGGKKYKERNYKLRKELYKLLFVCNIKDAIEYINNIPSSYIKDESKLEELKNYYERKEEFLYSYAVRKMLGLINSSNLVETLNNLSVSKRCKDDSKSWSQKGVDAIANINMIFLNKESDWFRKRILNQKPVPLSELKLSKINKLNQNHEILCA